ncbi:MAG TPA: glycoside hydrolase family 3 protein [Gaiellaceae bacterium]|jgi:beta-N-acetylhexosaminidase|nr:glycoside hydrolase family 3 protein [Gaiellaceae bacterium]
MSAELERLAATCIFPSFPGYTAPSWALRRIEAGLGGICLFAYNVGDLSQLAELTASLGAVRPGLLIGIDEEGGDVTRLELARGSSFPAAGALGAVDDDELTAHVAAGIGAALASVGVNLDFAPVADVNVNPANPVIGSRSFGADAHLVARHVAAFVDGLQSQGVAGCAKHFPGHGSTEQDSHLELPVVTGDVREGLEPFRAAIAAGVQTIMTAHVRVPELDDAPATASRRIIHGLLREELGYNGLVIADALEMKGLSETIGIERGAVLALAAGVDALLVGHDLGEDAVKAVQGALVAAVGSGELPEARLHEAAGRVEQTGSWTLSARAPQPVDGLAGRAVAERALRVEGDVALNGELPLVVELRPRVNIAAGDAGHSLGSVLAERVPGTGEIVLEGESPNLARALDARGNRRLVIVVRDAHRYTWMRDAADALVSSAPDAIVVEVGLPVWRPRARCSAATLGGSRVSFEALADAMLRDRA